jgi:CO/xanthine dehydrogenase FAD-binding subunit
MKAASFDYVRATGLDEACRALAEAGPDAKLIAGGQTLVPLMAMRFARPSLLVDLNDVPELAGVREEAGALVLGAMTRQRTVERSAVVSARLPLLAEAIRHVGHTQTRNRGTVGGSIVHGDPSAEIPLVARCLDAELSIVASGRSRTAAAGEFFVGAMETAIEPDECLTEIRFPLWENGLRVGTGFREVAMRDSDFAMVAVAVQLGFDAEGTCRRAAVAVGGAAPAPVRVDGAETALVGSPADAEAARAAASEVPAALAPDSDVHASADYRRRVAVALTERAISDARRAALEGEGKA